MNDQFFRQLFPNVAHFLGVTFHQDWADESPDPETAVSAFVAREKLEIVESVLADLRRLRETQIHENELDKLLLAVGCEYDYSLDHETARSWLMKIEGWLRAHIADRGQRFD